MRRVLLSLGAFLLALLAVYFLASMVELFFILKVSDPCVEFGFFEQPVQCQPSPPFEWFSAAKMAACVAAGVLLSGAIDRIQFNFPKGIKR